MNKIAIVKKLVILICLTLPTIAVAGTAYIPLFTIEPPNTELDYVQTAIFVNNISTVDQTIKITLLKDNGLPLASQPIVLKIGGILQSEQSATDSKGEVTATLGALKVLQVVLAGVDGTTAVIQGHGRITTSPIPDGNVGFVIANVFIRDSDHHNIDTIFQREISINGGNPF